MAIVGEVPSQQALDSNAMSLWQKLVNLDFRSYVSNMWTEKRGPDLLLVQAEPPEHQMKSLVNDDTLDYDSATVSHAQEVPEEAILQPPNYNHHVTVEEILDNDTNPNHTVHKIPDQDAEEYIQSFLDKYRAGACWWAGDTLPKFEALCQTQGENQFGPFEDCDEWELAELLIKNVGQGKTNAFLRLLIVSSFQGIIKKKNKWIWLGDKESHMAIIWHKQEFFQENWCLANSRLSMDLQYHCCTRGLNW